MDKDPAQVMDMFSRIAGRYDLMNTLMTLGRDQAWRRCVLRQAAPPPGGRLLDVACGTGPMALEAAARHPSVQVAAVDFTGQMVRTAMKRPGSERVDWSVADGLNLPFPDQTFDAVTSGYLIRNVNDPLQAFAEQVRVLKPGGRLACLDTCPPADNWLKPFIMVHMKHVIPLLGEWVAKNRAAYEYLPDTTTHFMTPGELMEIMKKAGLEQVGHRQFMFGTQSVLWGVRAS